MQAVDVPVRDFVLKTALGSRYEEMGACIPKPFHSESFRKLTSDRHHYGGSILALLSLSHASSRVWPTVPTRAACAYVGPDRGRSNPPTRRCEYLSPAT
jgi:hypothetical protein